MADAAGNGFTIKGWHVAAGVTLFFMTVTAVDATFVSLAYRTHPGQVSVTPYEDGLIYNQHLAQMRAQGRLGWRETVSNGPDGVTLHLVDSSGGPVRGLTVVGRLERPATEAGRIALSFAETAPGVYAAGARVPAGAWDLTAEARRRDGARFVAERRLTWP